MNGKPRKTVYCKLGIWYNEASGRIHIATKDAPALISTISPNPALKRGHPHLFNQFARMLRANGVHVEDAP